jgi:hypothetical protein
MRLARSITLVGCLATSTSPAAAQDRIEVTPGPIVQAIAREAVRLAVDPRSGSADVEWSRVRKLAPGTEIIVTVEGSQPGARYVVRGDESELTVLNVADQPLPAAATGVLRDVASNHPDYFSAAQQRGTFVLQKSVRLRLDGVFVGDQRVADLAQVVQTIARSDIAEIKVRQKGRGVWGHLGPLGGYFVGAMSGGFVAGLAGQAVVGRDRSDTGAFLAGALVGGIAGGLYGFRAANRETEDVIYRISRAP